jgi:23S rRNA pseudouridine1911/1915/1917 synthase
VTQATILESGRLDVALSKAAGISRALARVWLESGAVQLNGESTKKASQPVKSGDALAWTPPPPMPSEILPEDIPLTILYEDDFLIVIDKPAGMLVHPAAHVHSGTLVNALLGRVPLALEGEDFGAEGYRPGIVHRLDQDTSGVIVVAKTREAHSKLASAFANRQTKKHYLAITVGVPDNVTVNASIGRHPTIKTRMSVAGTNARDAQTDFFVLDTTPSRHALVRCRIHTGRTHQIRVHLQHLKTPILGDDVYGKPSSLIDRQALHAHSLEFQHPISMEWLKVECSPPEDMVQAWMAVGGGAFLW